MTTWSGVLEFKGFQPCLSEWCAFFKVQEKCRFGAVMMHAIDAAGENSEWLAYLQHFRAVFDCPVERAMCDEVWANWEVHDLPRLCSAVARFVDK